MKLTVKKIVSICEGTLLIGNELLEIENYSKDTRTIQENDCYLGIKGENFDGNLFWKEAFLKGASACILDHFDKDASIIKGTIILVKDTVKALQALAMYVREESKIPVIAITGSAGKTTTKDMLTKVLEEKYKVLTAKGNLNSQIGLPLTILTYKDEDVMVLEMGMNAFGQIDTLSRIAKPNIAVITNIGTAHIGLLGSRENILKAKLEIINGMNTEGILICNGDNDLLGSMKDIKQSKKTFGFQEKNNLIARNIRFENGSTYFECEKTTYQLPTIGEVFVYNALAAIGVAKELGLTTEEIKNGLKSFSLSENRMELVKTKKYTLINDTYNANLEAMKSAIDILSTFTTRKVAILGDMLELGPFAQAIHEEVGTYLNGKVDEVITIGSLSKFINDQYQGKKKHYDSLEESIKEIPKQLQKNDIILIKASQGMKLFLLVDALKN